MAEQAPIVALVDDLLLASRVEANCRALGWPVVFPRGTETFWTLLRERRPALVLVGMSATRLPWETLVSEMKRDPTLRDVPVVAFGSHMDLALRQRAREAGCDRVVANSQIATEFASLLAQVGLGAAAGGQPK